MENPDFLTPSEIEILLNKTDNLKHRLMILILADTGVRVSEMLDLKWSDCDFKKRQISVESLKKKEKDGLRRLIPISSRLYDCFYKVIEKTKKDDLKGYIFTSPTNSNEPQSRQSVYNMLKRIESDTPDVSNVHPHKLRHSFATNLRANGAEIEDIRDLLGHEKVETSLIYAHADQKKLLEKIEGKAKQIGFFEKMKLAIFPPKRPKLINLNISDKSLCIGREKELKEIEAHVNKGLHVILTGGIGVGKSHILEHINFGQKKILSMDNVKDFKKSIANILLFLFDDDKETVAQMLFGTREKSKWEKKMQTDSLTSLIIYLKTVVQPQEYILKIGDINDITPTVVKALDDLKSHFLIITSATKLKQEHTSFAWNFEKVEIKNLDRTNALRLFHRMTEGLEFENLEFTRNRIWDASEGNPKIICELSERLSKEPVLDGHVVEEITLGYLGRQIREIDMTPIFAVIVIILIVSVKFVGRASGDADLKSISGVLSICVFLLGRFFFNRHKKSTF